jgi:hypothetical protein
VTRRSLTGASRVARVFRRSHSRIPACVAIGTSAGRLIDSAGNDLEPDGYITFYTVDREEDDSEAHASVPGLREYSPRFLSGQLQNIVRVGEDRADRIRYGLASFRWFEPRSFLFGDPDEASDASQNDVGSGK